MSKTLDRISALLAQAEGTTNPDEAEAYMAKAQALATNAAIDLEIARQHQRDRSKREQPIQKRIQIAERVGESRKVQNNAAEFVELFLAVGRNNDLMFDIARDSSWVYAYGMPSDIEVTEALYASLLLQMQQSCAEALATGEYKQEKGETYFDERTYTWKVRRPDARRFKTSFYQSFIARVSFRLATARAVAVAAAKTEKVFLLDVTNDEGEVLQVKSDGALVLKGKSVEVNDHYKATSMARGSYRGAKREQVSLTGSRAGDAAGRSARLGAAKSIQNRKEIIP